MKQSHIRTRISEKLSPEQAAALVHIAEEAAEIVVAATKALRFGLTDTDDTVNPPKTYNNHTDLVNEYHDLQHAFDIYARTV